MLIHSFPAGPWQTNCYIVAPSAGSECLIIDPGQAASGPARAYIDEMGLKPIAVMVTHGHLDHMWSVFPMATGYDIPAYVHKADRHLLSNPAAGVSQETLQALSHMVSTDDVFAEPDEVYEISGNSSLNLAGFDLTISHAPGHTAGSVLFDILQEERYVFTGDVLFAGAIGRTDLPGGSAEAMNASLLDVILPIDDGAHILPGHGPSSTMGIERGTNPYLRRIAQGLSAT
jgi:glyoxylase-like metal-dependent hydrolase (beta-lactamase superfamily II)